MVNEATIAIGIAFWGFFASSPDDNTEFYKLYIITVIIIRRTVPEFSGNYIV
jgi:hypothetical protein